MLSGLNWTELNWIELNWTEELTTIHFNSQMLGQVFGFILYWIQGVAMFKEEFTKCFLMLM